MNRQAYLMGVGILVLSARSVVAENPQPTASVCFVVNAPEVVNLKVEGEERVYIDEVERGSVFGAFPRVIATGLEPGKKHHLTVKRGDNVLLSMPIRIRKNVTMLAFWQRGGYWHIEPSPSGQCDSSIFQNGSTQP